MHIDKKMKFWGAACLVLAAGAPPAWSQGSPPPSQWNVYSATHGLEIVYNPLVGGTPTSGALNYKIGDQYSSKAAQLHIKVGDSLRIPVTIDTGSTGIAISAAHLPPDALKGLKSLG